MDSISGVKWQTEEKTEAGRRGRGHSSRNRGNRDKQTRLSSTHSNCDREGGDWQTITRRTTRTIALTRPSHPGSFSTQTTTILTGCKMNNSLRPTQAPLKKNDGRIGDARQRNTCKTSSRTLATYQSIRILHQGSAKRTTPLSK